MLAAEAQRARVVRDSGGKSAEPVERKPTATVRMPPIPRRADRDLAAAARRTASGESIPPPVTAPGSGPAALPKPITEVIATRRGRDATPSSVTAKTKAEAAVASDAKVAAKARAEAAAAKAAAAAEAAAAKAAAAEATAKSRADSQDREDPSAPQLLAPHPARKPESERPDSSSVHTGDDWPDPAAVASGASANDSNEWPSAEDSAGFAAPPTRPQLAGTKSKSPSVDPVPEVPDGGLWAQVRYLVRFSKARWQRRGAISTLKEQITSDTGSLDTVLGDLGAAVRKLKLDNRALAAENAAIDGAEARKAAADHDFAELQKRQAEENNRFAEIENDRQAKVDEAETTLESAKRELGSLEAQRRGLRDKRKGVQRQQEGLVKAGEDRESKAGKLPMGEERAALRRSAEELRREASGLDPDRQDIDRRLAALEKPISVATAKVEALKAELESAKRSLNDAREGHRHKQSEIDAEKGKRSRELAQAEAEIKRRLVTLGTIVNLNRIDRDEFVEEYGRIDVLRGAIGSRTTEIDRLSAEREAYDKQALLRGGLILGGVLLLLCIVIGVLILAI